MISQMINEAHYLVRKLMRMACQRENIQLRDLCIS